MISFIVKVKFTDGTSHEAEFLAEGWADAMPQAAEIVDAVERQAPAVLGATEKVTVKPLG